MNFQKVTKNSSNSVWCLKGYISSSSRWSFQAAMILLCHCQLWFSRIPSQFQKNCRYLEKDIPLQLLHFKDLIICLSDSQRFLSLKCYLLRLIPVLDLPPWTLKSLPEIEKLSKVHFNRFYPWRNVFKKWEENYFRLDRSLLNYDQCCTQSSVDHLRIKSHVRQLYFVTQRCCPSLRAMNEIY